MCPEYDFLEEWGGGVDIGPLRPGGAWRPRAPHCGGASGHFWTDDRSRCIAFFNTVILIYYTHVFDEVGK